MDTRLFARIGAGAFVAAVLTMTVLQVREEPRVPPSQVITVWEPGGDPLTAQLRACSAMGDQALSSHDCRAAWAEKRRQFLGVEGKAKKPAADAVDSPPPLTEPQPAKGQ